MACSPPLVQELESVVQQGRKDILKEHARQRQVREKNLLSLEQALLALERVHSERIDSKIQEEQRVLERVGHYVCPHDCWE